MSPPHPIGRRILGYNTISHTLKTLLAGVKWAFDGETKAQRGSDGLAPPLTQPHTHHIWKLFCQDTAYSLGWSTPTGVTCLALTTLKDDVIFFFPSLSLISSFAFLWSNLLVTGGRAVAVPS